MDYVSCTESNAGPILDFVWAGLNVLGAAAAAVDPGYYEDSGQVIAVGLLWAVVSTASGVVGLNKTKKCRTAKQQMAARERHGVPGVAAGADAEVLSVVVLTSDGGYPEGRWGTDSIGRCCVQFSGLRHPQQTVHLVVIERGHRVGEQLWIGHRPRCRGGRDHCKHRQHRRGRQRRGCPTSARAKWSTAATVALAI